MISEETRHACPVGCGLCSLGRLDKTEEFKVWFGAHGEKGRALVPRSPSPGVCGESDLLPKACLTHGAWILDSEVSPALGVYSGLTLLQLGLPTGFKKGAATSHSCRPWTLGPG